MQGTVEVLSETDLIIKPFYSIFEPDSGKDFEEQWPVCLSKLQHFLNKNPNFKAFIVRVFVCARDTNEFQTLKSKIRSDFSESEFPVTILSQAPEEPVRVMIEAGFADSFSVTIEYGRTDTVKFCRLTTPSATEVWFAGIESHPKGNDRYAESKDAFIILKNALDRTGQRFDGIVRQWNYVENITAIRNNSNSTHQNYQQFNEARSEFYAQYRTVPYFPAATGIGTDFGGVTLECATVTGNERLKILPVNNPKQYNSYHYRQTVLKGDPIKNKPENQPPQFERALLLTNGQSSRLFISGTASIIGQETVGENDPAQQTMLTIQNIEMLSSGENLKTQHPELQVIPDTFCYIRVYIKRENDFPVIRKICREHFGNIPMSFVKADICRNNLLVEIEAELFGNSRLS